MTTRVHVAQDAIRKNLKHGTNDPAIIVRRGSESSRHHEVEIILHNGQEVGRFVYSPDKPLSCGARVWFEVNKDVAYVKGV